MQTDLPLPVAPATSRWGIRHRSPTTGCPETSAPSATASRLRGSEKAGAVTISLRETSWAALLGTSMPTADLPGMKGWIRIGAARARERSV